MDQGTGEASNIDSQYIDTEFATLLNNSKRSYVHIVPKATTGTGMTLV